MKVFKEYSQSQRFLLPPSLDEFVPEDHDVRVISDVVDSIDLSALLRRYEGGGAPAYHPAMMLKVLIYAYSTGIYSSREISKGLKTDTAFMYLSGMQRPDFHTICIFRSQQAEALPEVFVEVVRLCASLGMVQLGHVAFDGTKLKANASVRQSRDSAGLKKEIERIREEMKEMVEASARIDGWEDQAYPDGDGSEIPKELIRKEDRLRKLEEAKQALEGERLKKVNVTDPEAPLMRDAHGRIQPAYNGQIAVDDKEQVIVAAAITRCEADNDLFRPMMEQVKENLGSLPGQASADAGYFSYDNLEYAQAKVDLYLPDPLLRALSTDEEGKFKYEKSRFRYDAKADVYLCPEGKSLRRSGERKRSGKLPMMVYRGDSCGDCAKRQRCTRRLVREVFRDGREALLEAMRAKLQTEEGGKTYNRRMFTVEPVFAEMKWNRAKMMLSMRGKRKVNAEFCLMCLTHNVKKIIWRLRRDFILFFKAACIIEAWNAIAEKNYLALVCVAN